MTDGAGSFFEGVRPRVFPELRKPDEVIVSMVSVKDRLFLATSRNVYELIGGLWCPMVFAGDGVGPEKSEKKIRLRKVHRFPTGEPKPWEVAGVSRATWYRRRAEREGGGSAE